MSEDRTPTPSPLEEREMLARQLLRAHHAEVDPDAGFAARVSMKLEARGAELALGWAVRQVLPPATALAAVLAAWWVSVPDPSLLAADDLMVWLAGGLP
ncbi:MAG: hypothetical protein AAGD38_15610 [Acidobacteriota bacterium]